MAMEERIILSLPHMGGGERRWVDKAFESNWIVPLGPNVDEFERLLAEYLGVEHVVALSAGTAAIHLGLVMAGVRAGDEVICQSFTFSASANPILYQGARPVFVDSERDTWNMDPELLENAIIDRKKVTGKYPKAIVPVALYGMPPKLDEIMAVADRYGITVVEDAAEALGSSYKGRFCGTFGHYGALSFNGNKVITTSGGGALVCPDAEAAARVKFYATQAREKRPYYYHETVGYNYRMSNVSAGIGCGQMEVLQEHVDHRREIHSLYAAGLDGVEGLSVKNAPDPDFGPNYWLSTVIIDPATGIVPDDMRVELDKANIETRLLWRPMHMQPVFADAPMYGGEVGHDLFAAGLCLPSGSILTDAQIGRVIDEIHRIMCRR